MSSEISWQQFFSIPPSQILEWKKSAQERNWPLLHWALIHQKIDTLNYLQWASHTYSLPFLSPSFFHTTPFDKSLFKKVGTKIAWAPNLVPLAVWDETLFVGCEEMPGPEISALPGVRFVLSAAEDLQRIYEELLSLEAKRIPPPPVVATAPVATPVAAPAIEAPEGIQLNYTPSLDNLTVPEGLRFDLAPEKENAILETTYSSVDFSAPEGLTSQLKDIAPPPPTEPYASKPMPDEMQAKSLEEKSSAAKSAKITADIPAEKASVEKLQFDTSTSAQSKVAVDNPIGKAGLGVVKAEVELEVATTTPVSKTVEGVKVASAPAASSTSTKRSVVTSLLRSIELTQTTESRAKLIEITKSVPTFHNSSSYEEVAKVAFRMVVPPFDRAMMLVFQGGQLRPWKWSSGFESEKSRPDAIPLDQASVFRIVYSTMLPYHGRVVTNDINQKFFDQLCSGKVPKLLTIVPLLIDRQIAAMLLADSQGEINLRSSLSLMERVGAQASEALSRLRTVGKQDAA